MVGSLVTRLAPAESALAAENPYALGPDRRTNWALHKNSQKATVSQLASGVKIDTPSKLPDAEYAQVALWARQQVSGNFRCRFYYTALVKPLIDGESFSLFYFDVTGQGFSHLSR